MFVHVDKKETGLKITQVTVTIPCFPFSKKEGPVE